MADEYDSTCLIALLVNSVDTFLLLQSFHICIIQSRTFWNPQRYLVHVLLTLVVSILLVVTRQVFRVVVYGILSAVHALVLVVIGSCVGMVGHVWVHTRVHESVSHDLVRLWGLCTTKPNKAFLLLHRLSTWGLQPQAVPTLRILHVLKLFSRTSRAGLDQRLCTRLRRPDNRHTFLVFLRARGIKLRWFGAVGIIQIKVVRALSFVIAWSFDLIVDP